MGVPSAETCTLPTPPPSQAPPTPPPTLNCKAWCAKDTRPWAQKCQWTSVCGCSECGNPSQTPAPPTQAPPTPTLPTAAPPTIAPPAMAPPGACVTVHSGLPCIFPFNHSKYANGTRITLNACVRYGTYNWCPTKVDAEGLVLESGSCAVSCPCTWAGHGGNPIVTCDNDACPEVSATPGRCGPSYGRCDGNAENVYCEDPFYQYSGSNNDGRCVGWKPQGNGYTARPDMYDWVPSAETCTLPTPPPTQAPPTSSPTLNCRAWCAKDTRPWAQKCQWTSVCGCSECGSSLPTPAPPTMAPPTTPPPGACVTVDSGLPCIFPFNHSKYANGTRITLNACVRYGTYNWCPTKVDAEGLVLESG